MNKAEALEMKEILEKAPGDPVSCRVIRILPVHIDPPSDDDNGWDLEVTILDTDTAPFVPDWDALRSVVR